MIADDCFWMARKPSQRRFSHARPREGFSNEKLFQWEKALRLIIN
jgi:hypothetical protein